MTDSCRPAKLDPGFAARYSKPSDLRTSTMKSEPGRLVVKTSTAGAASPSAAGGREGAAKGCAANAPALATSVATLPAAAPCKNLRRSTTAGLDSDLPGAFSSGSFMALYYLLGCSGNITHRVRRQHGLRSTLLGHRFL